MVMQNAECRMQNAEFHETLAFTQNCISKILAVFIDYLLTLQTPKK